jgi:hypothetical protein
MEINNVMEAEMAGYRLVDGEIVAITDKTELAAVGEALAQHAFPGAAAHLQRALELLTDKAKPDPRNSVKESISAVESAARALSGKPKAVLADALEKVEMKHRLHPALRGGFTKLYSYTSDEDGIRHAMGNGSDVTKSEALFFLVACSAFVNYLKSKS